MWYQILDETLAWAWQHVISVSEFREDRRTILSKKSKYVVDSDVRVLTSVSSAPYCFRTSGKCVMLCPLVTSCVSVPLCQYITQVRKWYKSSVQLRAALQRRCDRSIDGVKEVEKFWRRGARDQKRWTTVVEMQRINRGDVPSSQEQRLPAGGPSDQCRKEKKRRGRESKVDQQGGHSRICGTLHVPDSHPRCARSMFASARERVSYVHPWVSVLRICIRGCASSAFAFTGVRTLYLPPREFARSVFASVGVYASLQSRVCALPVCRHGCDSVVPSAGVCALRVCSRGWHIHARVCAPS